MVGFGIIRHGKLYSHSSYSARSNNWSKYERKRENTFVNSGNFNHLSLRPSSSLNHVFFLSFTMSPSAAPPHLKVHTRLSQECRPDQCFLPWIINVMGEDFFCMMRRNSWCLHPECIICICCMGKSICQNFRMDMKKY